MNNGFLFPPLKALPCIPDFIFFLKTGISCSAEKKCMLQEQCHLIHISEGCNSCDMKARDEWPQQDQAV